MEFWEDSNDSTNSDAPSDFDNDLNGSEEGDGRRSQGRRQAVHSVNFHTSDTGLSIVDFGEFWVKEGTQQRECAQFVLENLQRHIGMATFNAGTDPMVEAYVTAMMPAANAMHGSYKERFYAMMHTPLQLGTVFQFLLEIQKQFSYGIAPGVSFSDRLEEIPAFLRAPDAIDQPAFDCLWKLIDERVTEGASKSRLFEPLFTGNAGVKGIIDASMKFNRGLFKGVTQVDAVLDDLQTSARNNQEMADRGIRTGYNPKKASKQGVSYDVFTVDPRLQIVCGMVVQDSDAKAAGVTRAQAVRSFVEGLAREGTTVTTTLDRGMEAISQELASNGHHILTTSQKATVQRPLNVYYWDQARSFTGDAVNTHKHLSKKNNQKLSMTHFATNKFGEQEVLHVGYEKFRGKTPVALKSTHLSYLKAFISVPELESDRKRLAIRYREAAGQSSTAAHNAMAPTAAAVGSTGQPRGVRQAAQFVGAVGQAALAVGTVVGNAAQAVGTAVGQAAQSVAQTVQLVSPEERDTQCYMQARGGFHDLSGTQGTSAWHRARAAVTSTGLTEVTLWHRGAIVWNLFCGIGTSLRDILEALYRPEPAGSGIADPPGYQGFTTMDAMGGFNSGLEAHMGFLQSMEGVATPTLSNDLGAIAREGISSASPDLLARAIKSNKLGAVPRKGSGWRSDQVASMRETLSKGLQSKADLATRLLNNLLHEFKGNDYTRVGHVAEASVRSRLASLMVDQEFELHSSPGTKLRPFRTISNVSTTGCVAPADGSHCVASPDGIFVARSGQDEGPEAWILEVKAKATPDTVRAAASLSVNSFFKINSNSPITTLEKLRESLTDPAFSLQILHHAAATRVPRVLVAIVDGVQAKMMRYVAVEFAEELLERHRLTIDFLVAKLAPFWKRPTALSWGTIDCDRLNQYRELRNLGIAKKPDYAEKTLLPLMIFKYNTTKSGVDVLHRKMGGIATNDLGSGRRLMLMALAVIMASARQLARLSLAKHGISECLTPDDMSRVLNDVGSDRDVAFRIIRNFRRGVLNSLVPPAQDLNVVAVQEQPVVDPHYRPTDPLWEALVKEKRRKVVEGEAGKKTKRSKKKKKIRLANDDHQKGITAVVRAYSRDSDLSAMRRNSAPGWEHIQESAPKKHCEVCCADCEKAAKANQQDVDDGHLRHGQHTRHKCRLCQTWLCIYPRAQWGGRSCFEMFHVVQSLPDRHPYFMLPASTTATSAAAPYSSSASATPGFRLSATVNGQSMPVALTSHAQRRSHRLQTPQNHLKMKRRISSRRGAAATADEVHVGADDEDEEDEDDEDEDDEDEDEEDEDEDDGEEGSEDDEEEGEDEDDGEDDNEVNEEEDEDEQDDEQEEEEEVPVRHGKRRIAPRRVLDFIS